MCNLTVMIWLGFLNYNYSNSITTLIMMISTMVIMAVVITSATVKMELKLMTLISYDDYDDVMVVVFYWRQKML